MKPHLTDRIEKPRRKSVRAIVALWLLGLVVLLSQQLGLLHRTSHGLPAHGLASHAVVSTDAAHGHQHAASVGASDLAALFAGHHDEAGCALYDGATAGGTPSASTALTLAKPDQAVPEHPASRWVAALAVHFQARGPPSAQAPLSLV